MNNVSSCSVCCTIKSIDLFTIDRGKPTSRCKSCTAIYMKEYRKLNQSKLNERKAQYYKENIDKEKAAMAEYYSVNKERIKSNASVYEAQRLKTDPVFKLSKTLRHRLRMAIKNGQKTGSAVKDLGCSIVELKARLESQFQPGMTWSNHGNKGWHIDHIVPLDKFDLSDRNQLLKACHYTNLQPLWAKDNLSKSNKYQKIIEEFKLEE